MCKKFLCMLLVAISSITGTAMTAPDNLYMVGTVTYPAYSTSSPYEMTRVEGTNIYKADMVTVNQNSTLSGKGYFSFTTIKGTSFDEVNTAVRFGALSDAAPLASGVPTTMKMNAPGNQAASTYMWEIEAPFDYDIEVDFDRMVITANKHIYPETNITLSTPANLKVYRGESLDVPVTNLSTDPMIALQFNVEVPEGMTISNMTMAKHITDTHSFKYSLLDDGSYIVTLMSFSNQQFEFGTDPFCTITLTPGLEMTPGNLQVKITNMTAVDIYRQTIHPDDHAITVNVPNVPNHLYVIGMVNYSGWDTSRGLELRREGSVFKADCVPVTKSSPSSDTGSFIFVTKLSSSWDVIQQGERFVAASDGLKINSGVPTRFYRRAAGSTAQPDYQWQIAAPDDYDFELDFDNMYMYVTKHVYPTTPCELTVNDVAISPDKTAKLSVSMTTPDPMVNFQWTLRLPEGITVESASMKNAPKHSVAYNYVAAEGSYRFVVISGDNTPLDPANGAFLEITIKADAEMALGEYDVEFLDPVAANIYLKAVEIADFGCVLSITETPVVVELDHSQLSLQIDDQATLLATVGPDDIADKTVTWTSSNEAVATVDDEGVVTAVGAGTAIITATCGNGSATCTVTVGKMSQTIEWTEALDPMLVGDIVTLNATSTSGLPVTYVITEGDAYARVVGGNTIEALALGNFIVEARQAGDDTYAPAEPVSRKMTVWRGYLMGDVDTNGTVALADVTTTTNYCTNPAAVEVFSVTAADMDGNGVINTSDRTRIINLLLTPESERALAPRRIARAEGEWEQVIVTHPFSYTYNVSFTNRGNYIAMMFDIELPDDVKISYAGVGGGNHEVKYEKIADNVYRVISYSDNNSQFVSDGYIYLGFNKSDIDYKIFNVVVNKQSANGNTIDSPAFGAVMGLTGVETIDYDNEAETVYYDLRGIRVVNPAPGIYIRHQGTSVSKVIIR